MNFNLNDYTTNRSEISQKRSRNANLPTFGDIRKILKDSSLRQTADVNLYHVTKFLPYFPFTLCCFYTKISSFMPVLTIGIVVDCFYLLIFYSEKFST